MRTFYLSVPQEVVLDQADPKDLFLATSISNEDGRGFGSVEVYGWRVADSPDPVYRVLRIVLRPRISPIDLSIVGETAYPEDSEPDRALMAAGMLNIIGYEDFLRDIVRLGQDVIEKLKIRDMVNSCVNADNILKSMFSEHRFLAFYSSWDIRCSPGLVSNNYVAKLGDFVAFSAGVLTEKVETTIHFLMAMVDGWRLSGPKMLEAFSSAIKRAAEDVGIRLLEPRLSVSKDPTVVPRLSPFGAMMDNVALNFAGKSDNLDLLSFARGTYLEFTAHSLFIAPLVERALSLMMGSVPEFFLPFA